MSINLTCHRHFNFLNFEKVAVLTGENFYFILLTLPNNKVSDTTKKKCSYIHRSTGGDTATESANYCGPKTQIAKKNVKTTVLSENNR